MTVKIGISLLAGTVYYTCSSRVLNNLFYLDNLWFVAGADRENFEQATTGPEQLLVGVETHDTNKKGWSTTSQDDQL